MEFIKLIIKGTVCGIFYVSSFFWSMVLTIIYLHRDYIVYIIASATLTNIIIGLLMVSKSHLFAFYKGLISLTIGFITYWVYVKIDFVKYWINRTYSEGRLPGSNGLALFNNFVFYILGFSVAIIISFLITRKNMRKT